MSIHTIIKLILVEYKNNKMKYILSPKLVEFAHKVSMIPGMKKLIKPFYYSYKNSLDKKRKQLFQNNAYSVMSDFDKALSSIGIDYSIAFGTLLGAIREHGFIKHDMDLDTVVWFDDYSDQIKTTLNIFGFKLIHVYMLDNGQSGLEETYEKNNVSIDIFYFYPPIDKYPYTCLWKEVDGSTSINESMRRYGYVEVGRLELPLSKETVRIKFGPLYLPATKNYTEFLERRYGANYMIPDSSWCPSSKDSCYVKWLGKKAFYCEY